MVFQTQLNEKVTEESTISYKP